MSFRDPFLKPFQQKSYFYYHLLQFPALTVMVFLRRGIGFRLVPAWRILLLSFALLYVGMPYDAGSFAPAPPITPNQNIIVWLCATPGWLGLFGGLMGYVGAWHHWRRKKEMRQGIKHHSYDRGKSLLSFLPIQQSTLYRFFDPLIAIGAGVFAWRISHALGTWLMFAGFSLRFVEQVSYSVQLDQHLDAIDAAVDSETLSGVMERYEKPATAKASNESPISTDVSPELERLMARRQKRAK